MRIGPHMFCLLLGPQGLTQSLLAKGHSIQILKGRTGKGKIGRKEKRKEDREGGQSRARDNVAQACSAN
jgi:hypothetical protein